MSQDLLVENAKLRAALEFYADKANWSSPSRGFALQYDPEPSPVQKAGNWQYAADILASEPVKK
jgi:hypothetical protein